MENRWKIAKLKTIVVLIGLLVNASWTVGQVMPVDITAMAVSPHSNKLSDYYSPNLNKLRVSLLLKDPTEPSWDVYLRVKIQGNWMSLSSRIDYKPNHSIVINSGEFVTVSSSDLEELLLPMNLTVSGPKSNLLSSYGVLAEGAYTMEIAAYDYNTNKLVSRVVALPLNINLNNPPLLVLPPRETVVDLQQIQNLTFQWQDGLGHIRENNTNYCLRLYEVSPEDIAVDGASLLASNRVKKVFEVDDLNMKSYAIQNSIYPLEVGKKYIATVQVSTENGTVSFKNNGISEPLCFYYGYPENGKVELLEPVHDKRFSLGQHKIFTWNHSDKKLPKQTIVYQMKLAELANDSVNYLNAFDSTQSSYRKLEVKTNSYGKNAVELTDIKKETVYAWKVEAFTKQQKVGESRIQRFFGPPLVNFFYARSFRVDVVKATTKDIKHFSGIGLLYVTPKIKVEVKFENIALDDFGDVFYLASGEIRSAITLEPKELKPLKVEKNSTAYFNYQEICIGPNKAMVKGYLSWKLPFSTTSGKQDSVVTDSKWILYDEYTLLGCIPVKNNNNQFNLVSPYNYKLRINPESEFCINGSVYWFKFQGDVVIPDSENEKDENTIIPFNDVDNLFYIISKPQNKSSYYRIIPKTNIWLIPQTAIIDFSEDISPERFANEKDWKGIYFDEFNLKIEAEFDSKKQISLAHDAVVGYRLSDSLKVKAWAVTGGVTFATTAKLPEASTGHFNTFPSDLLSYCFNISNGNVNDSWIKGQMLIPFISETKQFAYTVPACNEGFLDGLLDQSLDGYQFTFNPQSEEQKVDITINRAVFAAKERLAMNISMYWPKMQAKVSNIEGFNAYGNYSIGFFESNGMTTLAEQVKVKFNSYQIVFDLAGAGSSAGVYSFGISGDVILGSDVSGDNGAPRSNLYSLSQNRYALASVTGMRDFSNSLMSEGKEGSFKPSMSSDLERQVDKIKEDKGKIEKDGQDISNSIDGGKDVILSSVDAKMNELGINTNVDEAEPSILAATDSTSNASVIAAKKEELKNDLINSFSDKLGFDVSNPSMSIENIVKTLDFIALLLPADKSAKLDSLSKEIKGFFGDEQSFFQGDLKNINKLVQDYLRDVIIAQVDKALLVLDELNGKVHTQVASGIKTVVGPVVTEVQGLNEALVYGIATEFIKLVDATGVNKYIDVNSLIANIAVNSVDSLNNKFADFIDRELVERLASRFSDSIFVRAKNGLRLAVVKTVESNLQTIISGQSLNLDVSGLVGDAENVIKTSVNSITLSAIEGDLKNVKKAFFQEFSPDAILSVFEYEFRKELSDATKLLAGVLQAEADRLIQQGLDQAIAGVTGGALSDLGVNVSMDFNNLGDKLKNGEIDKIIKLDPVFISIKASIISLSGYVNYERDNAVYGDVWLGDFNLEITKPKRIAVSGVYINGKKDGFSYWFCQVDPDVSSKSPTKLGTSLSQDPKVLGEPLNLGFVSIVALSGRVYHHMNETGNTIIPDKNTAYGAYLNMTFFDNQKAGSVLRLAFKTTFVINENDDYKIDFDGNLQVGSVSFSEVKADPYAPIQGFVKFSFNSAEDHFLGGGGIIINKPGTLCAQAFIWADIKPGNWNLAIGSRDNRFVFVPACSGWSPTGWLAISQTKADFGLGLMYSIAVKFGLNTSRLTLLFMLDAGIAAGIQAVVGLKPFAVEQVGIWIDLWAKLVVQYKLSLWLVKKSGTFTLIDALFKGDLIMRFKPSEIEGRISGKVKYLGFIKMAVDSKVKFKL